MLRVVREEEGGVEAVRMRADWRELFGGGVRARERTVEDLRRAERDSLSGTWYGRGGMVAARAASLEDLLGAEPDWSDTMS